MELTIKYQRDPELLRAQAREHFLATGKKLAWSSDREIKIDLEKITREQRESIQELFTTTYTPDSLRLNGFSLDSNGTYDEVGYRYYYPSQDSAWNLFFDHDLTEAEILTEISRLAEEKRQLTIEGETKTEENKQQALKEKKDEEEEETRKEAEEKAEKEARAKWIEKHGSDHLKRACEAGHTCSRLYLTERVAKEYPGALLDFDDHAGWNDRSCPTLAALDLRDKLLKKHPDAEIHIVWLTDFALNEERKDEEELSVREQEFEPHEAIWVRDPAIPRDLIIEVEERKK